MNRALVIVKAGDPSIADAVERGILSGKDARRAQARAEVVPPEVDWKHVAQLVRVAVGNNRTAEDYARLVTKARGDYGQTGRRPGRGRQRLLQGYALVVLALASAYRAQDRILGRR